VLTCKSLFGLGYRGERLIEPFGKSWWLIVVGNPRLVGLLSFAGLRDCQIAGTPSKHAGTAPPGKSWMGTSGKLGGMVTIQLPWDNRQPSAKGVSLCVQFTD